jgi:hypothetical protein
MPEPPPAPPFPRRLPAEVADRITTTAPPPKRRDEKDRC